MNKNILDEIKENVINEKFYDFTEMVKLINKVLGYDQRKAGKHFYPDTGDFTDWHKMKKYPVNDEENKHFLSSQIWYKEYRNDIENGIWKDTPYMDFWHWQVDKGVNEGFSNDSYGYVRINPEIAKNEKEWIKEIQQVWYDTFKEISVDGRVKIWISW